jgi:hypothetical protein
MKKIKLSLAALTLVLAIAGTTTVNATKAKSDTDFCSNVDPDHSSICTNEWPVDCCIDDNTSETIFSKLPKPF